MCVTLLIAAKVGLDPHVAVRDLREFLKVDLPDVVISGVCASLSLSPPQLRLVDVSLFCGDEHPGHYS